MMSFSQYLSESSNGRYVKIKPTNLPAYIRKIDNDSWRYNHRGIMGTVRKGWNRMGGAGYVAGNFHDQSGNRLDVPQVYQTHKTMEQAIHHAHEHVTYHMTKGKK